jgi:hypothetical protein
LVHLRNARQRAGSKKTVTIEGASHAVMMSHADAVVELVEQAAAAARSGPSTEIAFDENVECEPPFGISILPNKKIGQRLARFRQINMNNAVTHHDALEFPDGQVVLLTRLCAGQGATVLQLPIAAHPASAEEAVRREIREPSLLA